MSRPTKQHPERGDARSRLLEAARNVVRSKGFAATSIDDLCRAAGVTKGAFFHHFESKEALGIAAAAHWSEWTGALFAAAPYHRLPDPVDRVLGYVDFRRSIIEGNVMEFTCLVGTMTQEVYGAHPALRDACAASIFGHSETIEPYIEEAMATSGITGQWTPQSLSAHIQAVLQGAFILAKASDNPAVARDCIDHLKRYLELLFGRGAARA